MTRLKKTLWCFGVVLLLTAFYLVVAMRLRWFTPYGTILYGDRARQIFKTCSREAPNGVTGFYLPTLKEIDLLEKLLPAYLSKNGYGRAQYSEYRYQYAGFFRNKQNLIYVNAFYAHPEHISTSDWRMAPVVWCDGSLQFFGVEFDPASGKFSHLEYNGP